MQGDQILDPQIEATVTLGILSYLELDRVGATKIGIMGLTDFTWIEGKAVEYVLIRLMKKGLVSSFDNPRVGKGVRYKITEKGLLFLSNTLVLV